MISPGTTGVWHWLVLFQRKNQSLQPVPLQSLLQSELLLHVLS
nr:MAG TPA: hypothetical protein [Caudoviricetes sp.]